MGRRIRWLGVIMVVCLGLVVAQLVNIQLVKAKQLQTSPYNPRVAVAGARQPTRGTIYAADGTVLAKSVPTPAGDDRDRTTATTTSASTRTARSTPASPGTTRPLYYGTTGHRGGVRLLPRAAPAGAADAEPAALPREAADDHRQRAR